MAETPETNQPDYAVSIARRFRSNLLVTHVVNNDGFGLMAHGAIAQVLTGVKEVAALKIAEAMRSDYPEGVPYQAIVEEGSIIDKLLDIVQQRVLTWSFSGHMGAEAST